MGRRDSKERELSDWAGRPGFLSHLASPRRASSDKAFPRLIERAAASCRAALRISGSRSTVVRNQESPMYLGLIASTCGRDLYPIDFAAKSAGIATGARLRGPTPIIPDTQVDLSTGISAGPFEGPVSLGLCTQSEGRHGLKTATSPSSLNDRFASAPPALRSLRSWRPAPQYSDC
jgi:hypothetical protein